MLCYDKNAVKNICKYKISSSNKVLVSHLKIVILEREHMKILRSFDSTFTK